MIAARQLKNIVPVIKIRNGNRMTETFGSGNSQHYRDWRKKCQSGTVPKGDRFMEGVSTDDIRATLSKEKVANNLDVGLVMLDCL